MKTNQRGFSHIVLVLAIVVIAVVGFALYRVVTNDTKTNNNALNTSDSQNQADEINQTSEQVGEANPAGDTSKIESPKLGFTIQVPKAWNHRLCGDIDAVVFLEPGGDGVKQCLMSDASWPEDDWYKHGTVVIGVGENPYPRPGDLYDKDATQVTLGSNQAKKFTYKIATDKETGTEVTVVEYIIKGKSKTVTAKAFSGKAIDNFGLNISSSDVIKQIETALGTIQVQ